MPTRLDTPPESAMEPTGNLVTTIRQPKDSAASKESFHVCRSIQGRRCRPGITKFLIFCCCLAFSTAPGGADARQYPSQPATSPTTDGFPDSILFGDKLASSSGVGFIDDVDENFDYDAEPEGDTETTSRVPSSVPPSVAPTNRVLVQKAVLKDKDELALAAYDVDQGNVATQHPVRHHSAKSKQKRRHAPYFEREGKAVALAAEGGSAILHCRVRNLGQLALSWVRGRDLHILTAGKYVFTNDDRFSVLHQGRSEDWMLKIRHVSQDDKGIYKCQVSTPEGILSKVVELRIVQPRAVIPGNREYHVEHGSRMALECVIENSPQPPEYVFWYHNDRLVNFESDRPEMTVTLEKKKKTRILIVVEHVNFTDSGNYTCKAPNTIPASVNVFVTESDKPAAIQRRKLTSGAASISSPSPSSSSSNFVHFVRKNHFSWFTFIFRPHSTSPIAEMICLSLVAPFFLTTYLSIR